MRSVLEEIRKGQFHKIREGLTFSEDRLELTVKKDESLEGTFSIYADGGKPAEGYVLSTELRMECLVKEFFSVEEEIGFVFRSVGLEEGETVNGSFVILSDCGEYEIPYTIHIEKTKIFSSMGEVKNSFHFANLAKENWEEALELYYRAEFSGLFLKGSDRQFKALYKGLSRKKNNEQNLEEFLLEINKKQKVSIEAEMTEIKLENLHVSAEYELVLTRKGWGYTELTVESEGAFLEMGRRRLTAMDFEEGICRLPYQILFDELHGGLNGGSICIKGPYTGLTIPVTVLQHREQKRAYGIRREKKQLTVKLLEFYEAFRTKKISGRIWIREAGRVVEQLVSLDDKDLATQLFAAQIVITQEQYDEADRLMRRIERRITEEEHSIELECYYLYLSTLYDESCDFVKAVERVEQAYKENPGSWRLAWLMLYMSEEYSKSPSRKWLILKEQFKRGCRSPVLYIEAWHLLETNPTLLMKLGDFEVQVLRFAAKRSLLHQDVIVQLLYLAQKLKSYSEQIFIILQECYESYPDKETLQAICALLMKGNKTDARYFDWYRLGVEQELRITRLYEYFMMALPADYKEELPKVILMYFSYQSELDYRKNAILYAYVLQHRDEQPEIYLNYCDKIERFVLAQIEAGRINEELAYLYENTLTPRLIGSQTAENLATLLFVHEVVVTLPEIRFISVNYPMSREEYLYPVHEKRALVPLYSQDYKLILVDQNQNRFAAEEYYRIKKLMKRGKMTQLISPYVENHSGLDIFMCEGNKSFLSVHEGNADRFMRISEAQWLEEGYREEVRLKLISYYYEQDDLRKLDHYLERLEPDRMGTRQRAEIIRYLVLRAMYDKAFLWIEAYGAQGIEEKTVMRLCSRLIARDGYLEKNSLVYASMYAYLHGKYDVNLISYLVCFYQGTLRQQREIWKSATEFLVDPYEICERMLLQMLFTSYRINDWPEILKQYVAGGAKTEVEAGFLTQYAYDYFVQESMADEFLFLEIVRMYERGEVLHKVCKLAFLHYMAEHREKLDPKLQERLRKSLKRFLFDLTEENLYFSFFKDFLDLLPFPEQFVDKTIIEYRGVPRTKVEIHYLLEKEEKETGDYVVEEMREMYDGIYTASYILFFGERLQYYITEEVSGEKQVVMSASVNRNETKGQPGESRFDLLNDIVMARTLQDYSTVDCLLEEYYRRELEVSALFCLR